jgi:Translation elongation factor Ts
MRITAVMVKELREKTGYGMMECKKALNETNGDFTKAIEIMNEKAGASFINIKNRTANQGVIEAYVHSGSRIGVMLELNCETDFVANTVEFKTLAKDIAMQVVATNPSYVSIDELKDGEDIGSVLMEQQYIKDTNKQIKEIVNEAIKKFGENIVIKRFVRYEIH